MMFKIPLLFTLLTLSLSAHVRRRHDCLKRENCGPKVEIGVYIEALCPDTKNFILDQLYSTYNQLSSIMQLNLVPFGNADMEFVKNSTKNPNIIFNCQHGEQECIGNLIQSCAVLMLPIDQSLGLINCMFASPKWHRTDTVVYAEECANNLGLNWNQLSGCANSNEGYAIEYFMGGQTLALDPSVTWIPWITLNGQHTDAIQLNATTNLLKLVCDTYVGPKPSACDN